MFTRFLSLFFILFLFACSDSNQDNPPNFSPSTKTGNLSVFITDNLTESYSEVWVNVVHVKAINTEGEKFSVFSKADGQVFNLTELAGIGELLNSQELPIGTYNQFEITLARDIQLINLAAETENRVFAGKGNFLKLVVNGEFAVDENEVTAIALDFDLSQFKIDAEGNVTPAVLLVKNISKELKQTKAKIIGHITEIHENGFEVKLQASGMAISVVETDTTISHSDDGEAVDIALDQHVKVYGSFDADEMVLQAFKIHVLGNKKQINDPSGEDESEQDENNNSDSSESETEQDENNSSDSSESESEEEDSSAENESEEENNETGENQSDSEGDDNNTKPTHKHVEVEGIVTSISDNEIILDIKMANYMPGVDAIAVMLTDDTKFIRGNKDMLEIDQVLEISGMLSDDGFIIAKIVEIEGAGKDDSAEHDYAKIRAEVVGLDDNLLTFRVIEAYGVDLQADSEMTFNIEQSQYKRGDVDDLVAGEKILLKGSINDSNEFSLVMICFDHDESHHHHHPAMEEFAGEVLAISDTDMTVLVHKAERAGENTEGKELHVSINDDTHFARDHKPEVGNRVRVHAIKQDDMLVARNVIVKRKRLHEPKERRFFGMVSEVSDTAIVIKMRSSEGEMVDMSFIIDTDTKFKNDIAPAIDDHVHLIAIRSPENRETFIAIFIEAVIPEHPPMNEMSRHKGSIVELTDDSISIKNENGIIEFVINDETDIDEDHSLEVGKHVKIIATSDDEHLIALSIEVIRPILPAPKPEIFFGSVIEITETSITIENRIGDAFANERSFIINEHTEYRGDVLPELEDHVKILAKHTDTGSMAVFISVIVEPEPPVILQRFRGKVIELMDSSITISSGNFSNHSSNDVLFESISFALNDETIFVDDNVPAMDDWVKIIAQHTEDGLLAISVEVIKIDLPEPEHETFYGEVIVVTDTSFTIDLLTNGPGPSEIEFMITENTEFHNDVKPEVGDHAKVRALIDEDNYIAIEVGVRKKPPIFDDVWAHGEVIEITDESITIQGAIAVPVVSSMSTSSDILGLEVSFIITADTVFSNDHVPMVGDTVNIHGKQTETGYIALKVSLIKPPIIIPPAPIELHGVVVNISETEIIVTVSKIHDYDQSLVGTDITIAINGDTKFILPPDGTSNGNERTITEGDKVFVLMKEHEEQYVAVLIGLVLQPLPHPVPVNKIVFSGIIDEMSDLRIILVVSHSTPNDPDYTHETLQFTLHDNTIFINRENIVAGNEIQIVSIETEDGFKAIVVTGESTPAP